MSPMLNYLSVADQTVLDSGIVSRKNGGRASGWSMTTECFCVKMRCGRNGQRSWHVGDFSAKTGQCELHISEAVMHICRDTVASVNAHLSMPSKLSRQLLFEYLPRTICLMYSHIPQDTIIIQQYWHVRCSLHHIISPSSRIRRFIASSTFQAPSLPLSWTLFMHSFKFRNAFIT
jgi:hypothetical protein